MATTAGACVLAIWLLYERQRRMQADHSPLVYVLGPTASGKTDIAVELAWRLGSQIVNLDSRQLVDGMAIGTAKPTSAERRRASHHMIHYLTVRDARVEESVLRTLALGHIQQLRAMHETTPFVVGGAITLAESLIYGGEPEPANEKRVAQLHAMSADVLTEICHKNGYGLPFFIPADSPSGQEIVRTRLIRHILNRQFGNYKAHKNPSPGTLILGIWREATDMQGRIRRRVDAMFDGGLLEEVQALLQQSSGEWAEYLMDTIGYAECRPYFEGSCTLEQVRHAIVDHTQQLVEWQQAAMALYIPHITWVKDVAEAEQALRQHMHTVVGPKAAASWGVDRLKPGRTDVALPIDGGTRLLDWYTRYMERAKAVVFDIGGTLSTEKSWQALTRDLGASTDEESRIYRKYKAGEYTYDVAKSKVVALWKATGNATKQNFRRIFASWPVQPNAKRIVELAGTNRRACIITGSMDLYAEIVAGKLGIDQWYANTTLHWDAHDNLVDMDYELRQSERKVMQFSAFCHSNGLQPEDCLVIGDNEIDLALFALSRRGIMVGAKRPEEYAGLAWKAVETIADVEAILTTDNAVITRQV